MFLQRLLENFPWMSYHQSYVPHLYFSYYVLQVFVFLLVFLFSVVLYLVFLFVVIQYSYCSEMTTASAGYYLGPSVISV